MEDRDGMSLTVVAIVRRATTAVVATSGTTTVAVVKGVGMPVVGLTPLWGQDERRCQVGGRAGGEGFDASYGRTTSGTTTVVMG